MTIATIIQTILVITILCASSLGIFIYAKQKLYSPHVLLIIHLFSIAAWAVATLIVLQQEATYAVQLAYASAAVLVISKYYFIINFPNEKVSINPLTYIPLVIVTFLFILSFYDQLLVADYSVVDGSYVLIEDGPLGVLYMLVISAVVIYPIINLWRKMRSRKYSGHIANQIKFLFLGTLFFFILGVCANSILPVVFDIYYFNGIGPSLSLILAGFIVYIISKHHFLDLSLVIQRGLIYSVLITGIVGIYLFILYILHNVFNQVLSIGHIVSGALTTVIGIFTIPSIDNYLRRKTDRFFFKDRYNYSDVLRELSETLNRSIEITNIIKQTETLLGQALKAKTVHVDANPVPLDYSSKLLRSSLDSSGTLTIPLISNDKLVGRLSLEEKLSGDQYTPSDLQLLETLSYNLALALERALYHKQLKDYSKELESKVQQRTAELQEAYSSQQTMISNIAHGLQNPLTIIESEIETLKADQKLSSRVLILERSLSSISNFIYDLLRLVQLESKTSTLDLEKINFSLFVEEIISYISIMAADRNISLQVEILEGVYIEAEPKKIEEMILEIIGNAMKYLSAANNKILQVRLTADNKTVTLMIADSGIGIPESLLPKIFDRFYRVQDDRTTDINGSGLGLAIARAIIQKHNGDISVTSQVDIGTTFVITIPLSQKKPN